MNQNNNNEQEPALYALVIATLSLFLIIITFLVSQSCSPKIYPSHEYKDSVRVEIRERIDTVVATVTIEKQVEKIVTRDTTSYLENDYACSEAMVYNGFLYHSLESIPQIIERKVPVVVHDTTIVEKQSEKEVVIQKVEKELSWWQKFQMRGFWILASLAAICILLFVLKKKLI